jgi:hypothetical protein
LEGMHRNRRNKQIYTMGDKGRTVKESQEEDEEPRTEIVTTRTTTACVSTMGKTTHGSDQDLFLFWSDGDRAPTTLYSLYIYPRRLSTLTHSQRYGSRSCASCRSCTTATIPTSSLSTVPSCTRARYPIAWSTWTLGKRLPCVCPCWAASTFSTWEA